MLPLGAWECDVVSLLNSGVYGIPEAARYAEVSALNARRWFQGRRDYAPSRRVLASDVPDVGNHHAISFLDLIDLRVVGQFRARGIGMPTIRKVYARLSKRLESAHPFAHSKLWVFGKTVLEEMADDDGETELREVLTGQKAMHVILERYLKDVDYGGEHDLALRWNIFRGVVIDPTRNFGKPIVKTGGAGTFALARAYEANEQRAELVADLFETTPKAVLDAVAFEEWLASAVRSAA